MTDLRGAADVLFHDYGGHAFTAQIARHLARRGMKTAYVSFRGFATPKGRVGASENDPDGFRVEELNLPQPFDKDNLLRRRRQQLQYARLVADKVLRERPRIVVSSNCPLEVQSHLLAACRKVGASFVFWLQDMHSEAIGRIIGRRVPLLGALARRHYSRLEARLLRDSDAVIAITDQFIDFVGQTWGLETSHMMTIENWAPLEDLPLFPRDNPVAGEHFRAGRPRILYSGTLGRKHNPSILLDLARSTDADIHLYSVGSAADFVAASARESGLENVFVRPWVSVDDLPKLLAGADILCAFIEQDAGQFSVPSKVLSYLSAGRPILASIPEQNLASRTISRAKAGLVSAPGDTAGMVENARHLLAHPSERERMGNSGRRFAERTFDIDMIADRFENCFAKLGYTRVTSTRDVRIPDPAAV